MAMDWQHQGSVPFLKKNWGNVSCVVDLATDPVFFVVDLATDPVGTTRMTAWGAKRGGICGQIHYSSNVAFFVLVLSASGTRTRSAFFEYEYEYHFIEYEYDGNSDGALSRLAPAAHEERPGPRGLGHSALLVLKGRQDVAIGREPMVLNPAISSEP